ncbi:MAG: CbtB-domain containing protein [Paracoccaceae bacterium]|jgi:cobalt transporter subunit CbtB|nr:CbtB-domain containing protein [Paracoccaceae bacterium]
MQGQTKVLTLPTEITNSSSQFGAMFGAIIVGGFLLFASGFAQATIVHDSAHDLRHSMAFPCH